MYYLLLAGAGAAGQLIRAFIGIAKAIKENKDISFQYTLLTTISGCMIGAAVGIWQQDMRLAFISGYAGTDALEGMVKVAVK